MIKYYIYADGAYWGAWHAETAGAAIQAAADDVGTDGNIDGLKAVQAANQPETHKQENCECGIDEKGRWSETVFDRFGCGCG